MGNRKSFNWMQIHIEMKKSYGSGKFFNISSFFIADTHCVFLVATRDDYDERDVINSAGL